MKSSSVKALGYIFFTNVFSIRLLSSTFEFPQFKESKWKSRRVGCNQNSQPTVNQKVHKSAQTDLAHAKIHKL